MNNVDNIIRFENGEMTDDEIIAFFQNLLDTGLLYSLQGYYHRTARQLIDAGLITA
jgi:hypothetical protein